MKIPDVHKIPPTQRGEQTLHSLPTLVRIPPPSSLASRLQQTVHPSLDVLLRLATLPKLPPPDDVQLLFFSVETSGFMHREAKDFLKHLLASLPSSSSDYLSYSSISSCTLHLHRS